MREAIERAIGQMAQKTLELQGEVKGLLTAIQIIQEVLKEHEPNDSSEQPPANPE